MIRGALAILAGLLPMVASADCTVDTTRMKPKLSARALTLRNALFQQACESANGAFIDSTDPTLGKRLESPRALKIDNTARWLGHVGEVQLVFVIETDGSVTHVTVTESSGYEALDKAAVAMWSDARFGVAAKLDGQPIRALGYSRVPFSRR